jgi:hypothetical protein
VWLACLSMLQIPILVSMDVNYYSVLLGENTHYPVFIQSRVTLLLDLYTHGHWHFMYYATSIKRWIDDLIAILYILSFFKLNE